MNSVYIDLAIGLVLAFLLFSLLVSGVNEGLVRLLGIRSKFLWAYLRDTLDGAEGKRSWIPSTITEVFARLPFSKDARPAFIALPPPMRSTATTWSGRLYERLREIDHNRAGKTSIAAIPPGRFAGAVVEISTLEGGVPALLRKLEASHSPLYGPLKGLWDAAGDDLEAFRKGVEAWFDGEMQRLTLLYRRYVRWVIAALGLVLTLVFSMDSLEYGRSILTDNAIRAQVAATADGGAQALAGLRDRCPQHAADPYACVTEVLSAPAFVQIVGNAPVSVTIPDDGDPRWVWNGGRWLDRLVTPGHWPGFLVTFFALLFGAPFWWDILRRLTGIRSRAGETGAN
ncbi:hypothetical protein [Sphaerisporangium sp. TRM90804]|uniref:hypothetical protein n=1 Tax=Sphaerisporangium sp. TRM90804 TaxID=3031113 RepID=UPI00244D5DE9|nr:hypothetical protein [Sphaerisporangium sp. TRM90804]MDH2424620.1 hypothetical protein [Sphaerisporangium sp. TRM90804]